MSGWSSILSIFISCFILYYFSPGIIQSYIIQSYNRIIHHTIVSILCNSRFGREGVGQDHSLSRNHIKRCLQIPEQKQLFPEIPLMVTLRPQRRRPDIWKEETQVVLKIHLVLGVPRCSKMILDQSRRCAETINLKCRLTTQEPGDPLLS